MFSSVSRDGVVHVLDEDPDLGGSLAPDRLEEARRLLRATSFTLDPGERPGPFGAGRETGIGMLVLDGLMMRTVGLEGRYGTEILGRGDLLRPWQDEEDAPTLPVEARWRFLTPTRLALLDLAFTQRLGPFPEVVGCLMARAVQRSRQLAINMAIVHQPRIDDRLEMLLWHLAGRWGRVVPGGVTLTLPITHAVLAELVASRRPTVTSALGELTRRGVITPLEGGGWRLNGDGPAAPPTSSRAVPAAS